MAIWFKELTLEELNRFGKNTMTEFLGIEFTTPLHIGRSTQVWQVKIFNEVKKLTCISRMTASVINHPNK